MELNEKQREAVEYLDGPLLVLAGPGTGKTQLLGSKVEYILKNTDTLPENILCLTFTESGAQNMRERCHRLVGPEGLKVNVGTYHSFGRDILAQYKNYSPEYTRKLDDAIEGVAQFKIIKTLVERLPGTDIIRGDKVRDIVKIISEAKGARLSSDDLMTIATKNVEDSKVLSEAIAPFLARLVPRKFKESYEQAYTPIHEILKDYVNLPPILPRVERNIVELARDLNTAMEEAEEIQKIAPLSAWKNAYFEKDGDGEYRMKDRVKNLKLLSIARVMKMYDDYLRENGLIDFNDMIEEAISALEKDEGFKLTLEERYQYIMLDEFQDTNPAQLSIVKHLTDYEKPMVMAVGDDDQGIYAFQGALASNLRDFEEYYGAHVVTLNENYRSSQEILDFSRAVIEQAPDRYHDKHLIAFKGNPEHSQIERREFMSSDAECAYIARRIHELIESGVPQDEIAVLSYKTKYFMPLLPFLKEYPEIKIAYDRQDDVLADTKVYELTQVARYIYEIASQIKPTVSLMEILGYEFWNLPMTEVINLLERAKLEHKKTFEFLTETENEAIRRVGEFLAAMVAKAFTEPLEVFLDYLTGARELQGFRSPFLAYYTANENGDAAMFSLYENLATLRGTLHKYYGERSLKLADLIAMLDDYKMAGETINTTSPYKEADKAVAIMTAHKAKGLEFDYVFILTADTNAWGKGGGNHDTTSLPNNMTFIHHTGMTDGERLRILYVALTRARSHIIITNARHDFTGKERDRLEYFQEYEDDGHVYLPFLPDKEVVLDYTVPDIGTMARSVKDWFSRYFEPKPELRVRYKEKAKNLAFSHSALTKFIDVVYGGPVEFFKTYILPSLPGPDSEASAYGTLIHKTFEYVTNTLATDDAAISFFLNELSKCELPTEITTKLREKGPANLAVALGKFRPILEQGKAEVDFGPDRLVVNGVRVTGKIDHILIDEENKTIEVYDFKTSAYSSKDWKKHSGLFKYSLQLMFYKMLVENSPRFRKYRVKRGHILFAQPDADGKVYDKVYEYNTEDEKMFLALLTKVSELVKTLKFMDDPELFKEPDGTLGVKDIQEFIELILAKNI